MDNYPFWTLFISSLTIIIICSCCSRDIASNLSIEIFYEYDVQHLNSLNGLEETVDELKSKFTSEHYVRLSMGDCKVELNSLFISTISNLERVADHLVNIGNSIVNPTGDECNN